MNETSSSGRGESLLVERVLAKDAAPSGRELEPHRREGARNERRALQVD